MNRAFRTGINLAGFIAALIFLCSAFSFNVAAQIDSEKPLAAKSLAALISELKGVVQRTEPDAKNAARVAEKWDKHKDLAGKTKKQVINLLFEDVKSVITDAGTQYQISTVFSLYKQMPDESFSTKAPFPKDAKTKNAAVETLIDLTFESHPYVGIEEQIANLPGTKAVEESKEIDRKSRLEVFDAALKANNKLTPDQKSFVKTHYQRLSETTDKIIDETIKKNFPTEQWIKEGLRQSYRAKFTTAELDNLIAFFQDTDGRQILKYVRLSNMAEIITGNGGTLDYTANDKSRYDKFAGSAPGKKFLDAYIKDAEAYEQNKVNAVRNKNKDADGFAILELMNLNKLFNQFVAENYKK